MRPTRSIVLLWSGIGLVLLALGLVLAPVFSRTAECIDGYAEGVAGQARVDQVHEHGVSVVFADAQPTAPIRSCFVARGDLPEAMPGVGAMLDVVTHRSQPERCTTADTLVAAQSLLRALAAVVVCFALTLVLVGIGVQRSLTQVPSLTTRLDFAPERVRCPRCDKPMAEGYLPLVAGLHWRGRDEPVGVTNALGGLPGTASWRGRARVHALRCEPCELLLMRYGRSG